MSKGRFETDLIIDLTLGNIGSGGSSDTYENKLTVNQSPGATLDRTKGYRVDTVVNLSTNNQEYICIDDTPNSARWIRLFKTENDLKGTSGSANELVFCQENQMIYRYLGANDGWFPQDFSLQENGLMQIDEEWNRPYNKIPAGYVQFVYGLNVPSTTTLVVDGELVDLKQN